MSTAIAHSNIALVKYWGKRDTVLNLPATGSLSAALGDLTTTTTVRRIGSGGEDRVELDGETATGRAAERVSRFVDLVREIAGSDDRVEVASHNDFPTAAGLASSASGFAALTLATCDAFGLDLPQDQLSALARRGSGSAARSVPGGWAVMSRGEHADGTDAFARRFAPDDHWDLRCVVLVTAEGTKAVGSTEGMRHTTRTSPYFEAWVDTVSGDLADAQTAVVDRDFEQLATVAERSCLRMHATALAADPGVLYWNGATTELIHRVREARGSGSPLFFTIDAGPHVKVFCPPDHVETAEHLAGDLARRTIVSRIGGAAQLTESR